MALLPQAARKLGSINALSIASSQSLCIYLDAMGEGNSTMAVRHRAPARLVGFTNAALALASSLLFASVHASAQSRDTQSAEVDSAAPPSFIDSFRPYLPEAVPDLQIPPGAVDLTTFDPKRELEEELGGTAIRSLGIGTASYYGRRFHGRLTANGERFNMHGMTAAHKTLPFGTKVRVTNTRTGRSVVVRINDRGPFVRGRVIDLSRAAAQKIGMISSGHARVKLDIVR